MNQNKMNENKKDNQYSNKTNQYTSSKTPNAATDCNTTETSKTHKKSDSNR